MVLLRPWLSKELIEMRDAIYGRSGVVIQSAYRGSSGKRSYRERKTATPHLSRMMRGRLEMLKYMYLKFKFIERKARGDIALLARASQARGRYKEGKMKAMYNMNVQRGQAYIHATVKRQEYYEKKLRYQAKSIIINERRKLYAQELISTAYLSDVRREARAEANERRVSGLEDDYSEMIDYKRGLEVYERHKERCILDAEEMRRRGSKAAGKVPHRNPNSTVMTREKDQPQRPSNLILKS